MKTPFLHSLLVAGLRSPAASGFSGYDFARPIGMPESHGVKYTARVAIGYDSNVNMSAEDEEDGLFTELGAGASYSDQEAATKIRYNINLAARLYEDSAQGTGREAFANCNLTASLSHAFGAGQVYTTTLRAQISPDMDFSNAISSSYAQGETFNWSWNHAYSKAIDSRWSWTANASYNGYIYTDTTWRYLDRQYLTGGLSLAYRASSLTTYNGGISYRHDFRSEGENSKNVYFNVGADHSLDAVSSVSATLGLQLKMIAGETKVYPNIRFAYRREIGEGLSASAYFSFDNENIDTGRSSGEMYLSDMTVRSGVNLRYKYTHKVSFHADASVLNRNYSDHTGGADDRTDTTWVLAAGMSYKFTERLTGKIDYKFTTADQDWGDYDRHRISTGVSYSF